VEDREVGTFLKPVMGIVSVVDLNFLWTTGGDLNKSELTAGVFFTVAVKTEGFPRQIQFPYSLHFYLPSA
jgi:hypothetical protein